MLICFTTGWLAFKPTTPNCEASALTNVPPAMSFKGISVWLCGGVQGLMGLRSIKQQSFKILWSHKWVLMPAVAWRAVSWSLNVCPAQSRTAWHYMQLITGLKLVTNWKWNCNFYSPPAAEPIDLGRVCFWVIITDVNGCFESYLPW